MKCYKCQAQNPDGKKYCGDCGALLDSSINMLNEFLESKLQSKIRIELKEQLKDQKLVESEISNTVHDNLIKWVKRTGFWIGVPLAILAITLGILGIKSYSDFIKTINTGKQEITKAYQQRQQEAEKEAEVFRQKAEEFRKDSEDLSQKSSDLKKTYEELESQLADISTLTEDIKNLTKKVNKIEKMVSFEHSSALSSDLKLKEELEASFASFIKYLNRLGYKGKEGELSVFVDPNAKNISQYRPEQKRLVIKAPFARDKHLVYQTCTQHVLGELSKDFTSKKSARGIRSGLADYFCCSFSNNPLFGQEMAKVYKAQGHPITKPYLRNLDNNRKFSEINEKSLPQSIGEIWGGAFWEIRKLLGQDAADKLLFSTWSGLQSSKVGSDIGAFFVKKLLENNQDIGGGKYTDEIRSIFVRRGLNL